MVHLLNKWSDFHEYFTTNVASDKEVPATFGKLTEIGVQIYALVTSAKEVV